MHKFFSYMSNIALLYMSGAGSWWKLVSMIPLGHADRQWAGSKVHPELELQSETKCHAKKE